MGSYVPEQLQGSKRVSEYLIGYELQVFSYTNLFWHPRRNDYVVPGGMLQQIFSADIGNLVANFVLSAAPPEGFTYAGNKARFPSKKSKDKDFSLPTELSEVEQYVRLRFVARRQEFAYNFKLRKEALSAEKPLEYRLAQYRSIDGILKERESERVVPWFQKLPGKNLPHPGIFSLVVNTEITGLDQN